MFRTQHFLVFSLIPLFSFVLAQSAFVKVGTNFAIVTSSPSNSLNTTWSHCHDVVCPSFSNTSTFGLASIHSDSELHEINELQKNGLDAQTWQNSYFQNFASFSSDCWIGLHSSGTEWIWRDHSIFDYSNWSHQTPDHSRANQCVAIASDSFSTWVPHNCNDKLSCCVCNYNYYKNNSYQIQPNMRKKINSNDATHSMRRVLQVYSTSQTVANVSETSENVIEAVENENLDKDESGVSDVFDTDFDSTTSYFVVLVAFLVLVSCCVSGLAWVHMHCDTTYDDVNFGAVFVFGLQMFDFYSDVNFAACLGDLYARGQDVTFLALFVLSVMFVVGPWLYNICFLVYMQKINWMGNALCSAWNRMHRPKLVLSVMLSGGVFYSVQLLNSRLFALTVLDMGLSHRQMLYIAQKTIVVSALFENLPQLCIQILYLLTPEAQFDLPVTMALISSSAAFVLAVVTSILHILDDLHDESMIIRITADCKNLDAKKQVKRRFRLRSRIRKAFAETMGQAHHLSIEIDSQLVTIKSLTKIECDMTISVHHFSTKVEINANDKHQGYSTHGTKLVKACDNGTLAKYLSVFLVPEQHASCVTISAEVCDVTPVPRELRKSRSLSLRQLQSIQPGLNSNQTNYTFSRKNKNKTVNIVSHSTRSPNLPSMTSVPSVPSMPSTSMQSVHDHSMRNLQNVHSQMSLNFAHSASNVGNLSVNSSHSLNNSPLGSQRSPSPAVSFNLPGVPRLQLSRTQLSNLPSPSNPSNSSNRVSSASNISSNMSSNHSDRSSRSTRTHPDACDTDSTRNTCATIMNIMYTQSSQTPGGVAVDNIKNDVQNIGNNKITPGLTEYSSVSNLGLNLVRGMTSNSTSSYNKMFATAGWSGRGGDKATEMAAHLSSLRHVETVETSGNDVTEGGKEVWEGQNSSERRVTYGREGDEQYESSEGRRRGSTQIVTDEGSLVVNYPDCGDSE